MADSAKEMTIKETVEDLELKMKADSAHHRKRVSDTKEYYNNLIESIRYECDHEFSRWRETYAHFDKAFAERVCNKCKKREKIGFGRMIKERNEQDEAKKINEKKEENKND